MRSLLVVGILLFGSACSFAQQTQQALEGQLVSKALFLRGLWKTDKLHFSADGVLDGSSDLTGPLLAGIEITKVELKPKGLRLRGQRLAVVYTDQKPQLLDLKEGIWIDVDAPAGGDYTAALAHIFTSSMVDLASSAPEYWQNFLEGNPEHLAVHDPNKKPGDDGFDQPPATPEGLRKIGGAVTPPRVLSAPRPRRHRAASFRAPHCDA